MFIWLPGQATYIKSTIRLYLMYSVCAIVLQRRSKQDNIGEKISITKGELTLSAAILYYYCTDKWALHNYRTEIMAI